jgi:hypothetical protein
VRRGLQSVRGGPARWVGGALVWAAAAGCGETDGRFVLELGFAEGVPRPAAGEALVVRGRVQIDRNRTVEAPPVAYRPGVRVDFEQVPYGPALVVEARLLPEDRPDAAPRYFGRSEPFAFEPGDDLRVPVAVALVSGPEIPDSPDGTPSVVVRNAVQGQVATPSLDLEVRARGADQLEVAQDFLFELGSQRFDADAVRVRAAPEPGGLDIYRFTYDLNQTLDRCRPGPGRDPANCEGLRALFVRAVRDTFRSEPAGTSVTLDTRAPDVRQVTVQYLPEPSNPARTVAAARTGTEVRVTVLLDEAVQTTGAQLRGRDGTAELSLPRIDAGTPASGALEFGRRIFPGDADGTYDLVLSAVDRAGNPVAEPDLDAAVRIDTTPDRLTVAQDRLSYVRAPFGNLAAETLTDDTGTVVHTIPAGPATFVLAPADPLQASDRLPADTFTLSEGGPARTIRVWADGDRNSLLATIPARGEAGSWLREDLRLANLDAPRVWVTGLDDAGNESAPVRLENVWWVAGSGQPEGPPSPHRVRRTDRVGPPLAERLAARAPDAFDGPDSHVDTVQAGYRWVERRPGGPSARDLIGSAFDAARGQFVVFGGSGLDGTNDDTWVWDGFAWEDVTPASPGPTARLAPAMAYDARRGRVVLFGGFGFGMNGDTWEWDGVQWTEVEPPGPLPPPRAEGQMVYDGGSGRVLMFGGAGANEATLSDGWAFDGERWTPLPANPPLPSGLGLAPAVWDSARNQLVKVGAASPGEPVEVWIWDGAGWNQVAANGPVPPARSGAQLVYDSASEEVVLLGGSSPAGGRRDVWRWNGTEWREVTPAGGLGFARVNAAAAFDPAREVVWLFGGLDADGGLLAFRDDTFRIDETGAEAVTPSREVPDARSEAAMAYDIRRRRTVLFGGLDAFETGRPFPDLWEWDGHRWNRQTPTVPTPGERAFHSMAFDAARGVSVVFGGDVVDPPVVWEWDGAAWDPIVSPDPNPGLRGSPAVAFDGSRVLMFGGRDAASEGKSDLWAWDGATWTRLATNGPPARTGHGMAYDPDRDRLVLFGGQALDFSVFGDTWEFDGNAWFQRATGGAAAPSPRSVPAMVHHAGRNRTLVIGGSSRTGTEADVWQWDGTAWTEVTPELGPSVARLGAAAAYDPDRDRVVLFGGQFNRLFSDTYELLSPTAPAWQLEAALPPEVDPDDLQAIQIRARCGGRFAPFGPDDAGAALWAWVGGGPGQPSGTWVELDGHDAAVGRAGEDPAWLEFRSSDADWARSLVGPDRRVFVQCRPRGGSGASFAEVAADYLEVRVRYAL